MRRAYSLPDHAQSPFPLIQTPRLNLRELVAGDAAAIFAIHSDADAMRWFGCDTMADLAAASQLIKIFASWRTMPNPGTRWGIEYQGQIVGSCGLFKWDKNAKHCHIGYELAQSHWGMGLMREALLAILAWGFEHMALNRIQAQVHPQNSASIKSLESLGFVQEGCFREAGFWHGQHHDLLQYALLKRDW
ncbi:ribosomal-protein-alanine N-acetyltransferase [Iodobacter fluviatilis]|uniref:Ribosomal-protein-alanine N-acetyltransferase n=1 Tax=Iodobacter fluviatilis TaxID=537 RepID=A0ABY2CEZ1_9NEIS|nr:ribosomal-protein-alanine N-acetyltransferase [Iodobacter fluviatilis]